ncbi:NifB/NifX family molybdenum-iron cluster-binding protein [Desulfoferrobacter suflitae]|uniref:NifB/NifX family molybdenum-iron cluster-binding protein n=1 Tax=Desulfoferrobacter suflitae TaxID=2865782 RepID=UPI002164BDA1|nr:NifB/NifX family molybdenum-iron cluster-binding protein [Desulfoferrobacter suflitae]MCK8601587.1 NifB/NifX family molybdenum-iron cluster-binding protein [Desulfoferrobacter suflitae]
MPNKVLVTLYGNDVAPRFDLATEVLIAAVDDAGAVHEEKTMVLPQASAEKLCHMVLTEEVRAVICGGIEQEYYDYLTWKRVVVIESVVGSYRRVLEEFARGRLKSGDILFDATVEEANGG